jgi:hypothetical protein
VQIHLSHKLTSPELLDASLPTEVDDDSPTVTRLLYTLYVVVINEGEEPEYVVAIALRAAIEWSLAAGGRCRSTARARRCSLMAAPTTSCAPARVSRCRLSYVSATSSGCRQGLAAVVSLGSGKTVTSSEDRLGDFLDGVDPSIHLGLPET